MVNVVSHTESAEMTSGVEPLLIAVTNPLYQPLYLRVINARPRVVRVTRAMLKYLGTTRYVSYREYPDSVTYGTRPQVDVMVVKVYNHYTTIYKKGCGRNFPEKKILEKRFLKKKSESKNERFDRATLHSALAFLEYKPPL